MGYEYQIELLTDKIPANLFEELASKINQSDQFKILSEDYLGISVGYKNSHIEYRDTNWDLFYLKRDNQSIYMLINGGNRKQIEEYIFSLFDELGINYTHEEL